MSKDKYPQVNWIYVSFCVLAGTGGLVFIAWLITSQVYGEWSRGLPISGGWSWPIVIGIDIGCFLLALALYWKVYCDSTTTIDCVEISQATLFGRRRIAWTEVTEIAVFGGVGFHVHAGRKKIVVTPYAYADPAGVIEKLRLNFVRSRPAQRAL